MGIMGIMGTQHFIDAIVAGEYSVGLSDSETACGWGDLWLGWLGLRSLQRMKLRSFM